MRAIVAAGAIALASCAGPEPAPDWEAAAHSALGGFTSAYLAGSTRAAEQDFARARSALSATGRADLVARAELVRCAARVASLEFDDCPGYRALAVDAAPAERAYAAYLAGVARDSDLARLPEHHRGVTTASLVSIADPFARLVAAGVLFRQARLSPAGFATAVDTASAQGWRRPLLAWLGVQQKRARDAGDREAADAIERRIRLVEGEGKGR